MSCLMRDEEMSCRTVIFDFPQPVILAAYRCPHRHVRGRLEGATVRRSYSLVAKSRREIPREKPLTNSRL